MDSLDTKDHTEPGAQTLQQKRVENTKCTQNSAKYSETKQTDWCQFFSCQCCNVQLCLFCCAISNTTSYVTVLSLFVTLLNKSSLSSLICCHDKISSRSRELNILYRLISWAECMVTPLINTKGCQAIKNVTCVRVTVLFGRPQTTDWHGLRPWITVRLL